MDLGGVVNVNKTKGKQILEGPHRSQCRGRAGRGDADNKDYSTMRTQAVAREAILLFIYSCCYIACVYT